MGKCVIVKTLRGYLRKFALRISHQTLFNHVWAPTCLPFRVRLSCFWWVLSWRPSRRRHRGIRSPSSLSLSFLRWEATLGLDPPPTSPAYFSCRRWKPPGFAGEPSRRSTRGSSFPITEQGKAAMEAASVRQKKPRWPSLSLNSQVGNAFPPSSLLPQLPVRFLWYLYPLRAPYFFASNLGLFLLFAVFFL